MKKPEPLLIDGQKLKQLRRKYGLSQEALADACERQHLRVSIATIKRSETQKSVTHRTLNNLSTFFNIAATELLLTQSDTEEQNTESSTLDVCITLAIKTASDQQRAFISREINMAGPVTVEQHGSYLVAAFSHADHFSPRPGKTFNVLAEKLEDIKRSTTLLEPIFCFIKLEKIPRDQRQYYISSEVISGLTRQTHFLPQNQVIVSNQLKILYDLQFSFEPLKSPESDQLWQMGPPSNRPAEQLPMYGRDSQSYQIVQAIEQCEHQKKAVSCCIVGDPGLGKTRMLEFCAEQAENAGFSVVRCDAAQYETDWFGQIQSQLCPDIQPLSSLIEENGTFDKDTLRACCSGQGLALLIDNLHACEQHSLESLKALTQAFGDCPFIVIVTTSFIATDRLLRFMQLHYWITLQPLSNTQCLQLSQHFPDCSPQWIGHSIERSDGIPFYLVLLLKQTQPAADGIPASIEWVIQEQLAALTPHQRAITQLLAAAGIPLSIQDIEILLDRSADCHALVQRQIVQIRGSNQLTIGHRLISEVILQMMPPQLRRRLHQNLADYMESRQDNEDIQIAEWLCRQYREADHHFKHAYQLGSYANMLIQRGHYDDAEQQLKLAEHALNSAENSFTTEYTQEMCDDIRLDHLFYLANIYKTRYGWYSPTLNDTYNRILTLADQTNSLHRKVAGLFGTWSIALTRLDLPQAMSNAEEALELSLRLEDASSRMQALTALSNTCFWAGEHSHAYQYAKQALNACDPEELEDALILSGQDPRMLPWCFLVLSAAHLRNENSIHQVDEMLRQSRLLNHPFSLAIALQAAAWHAWTLRQPEQTRDYANELLELSSRHNFPFYQGVASLFKGWADFQITGHSEHRATISNGFQRWLSSTSFKLTHSLYAVLLGEVLIDTDEPELALQLLKDAIDEAETQGTFCYLPELYILMARIGQYTDTDPEYWLDKAQQHDSCTPLQQAHIDTMLPRLIPD